MAAAVVCLQHEQNTARSLSYYSCHFCPSVFLLLALFVWNHCLKYLRILDESLLEKLCCVCTLHFFFLGATIWLVHKGTHQILHHMNKPIKAVCSPLAAGPPLGLAR